MIQDIRKIHLKNGRIITLTVHKETDVNILGSDKYNVPTIVAIKDIESMLPVETRVS